MLVSHSSRPSLRASKRRRISPRISEQCCSTHRSRSSSTSSAVTSLGTSATSCSPKPTIAVRSNHPESFRRFLRWCKDQEITINTSLDLRYSGDEFSWSISCHASTRIPTDKVLTTIPKTAVLSRKTSALASVLKGQWLSDSHETIGLELALCLLYERLLGSKSRFEPFISILPRLPVPLPFLRNSSTHFTSSSCTLPWKWLNGTEADRIDLRATYSYLASSSYGTEWRYDHDYGMSLSKAQTYFYEFGIPILAKTNLFDANLSGHLDALEGAFLTAYTHVSSRDFIIDTYHGVGLVPVADLFNHAEVNGVQFESDQEVCELCGLAFLTGHQEDVCRCGVSGEEEEEKDLQSSEEEDRDRDRDEGELEEGKVSEEQSERDEDDKAHELAGRDSGNFATGKKDEDNANGTDQRQDYVHPDQDGKDDEENDKPIVENRDNDEKDYDEKKEKTDIGEDDEESEHKDTLDMRTIFAHQTGEEMYNTYGQLPNSLLLTRYGFVLDVETEMERYTLDLRFPSERQAFLSAFVHGTSTCVPFTSIQAVEKAFDQVLLMIAYQFPSNNEKENESESEAEAVDREGEEEELNFGQLDLERNAIDALYKLDTLVSSNPTTTTTTTTTWSSFFDWLSTHFSSPFKPNGTFTETSIPIDPDLVDRDQIHPLFLTSTGQTSITLFLLTFLIHHHHNHSHSNFDSGSANDIATILLSSLPSFNHKPILEKMEKGQMIRATLETLINFWQQRLNLLYISSNLQQGLSILEPKPKKQSRGEVEFHYDDDYFDVEKACIQHAYQELVALQNAIATLQDLTSPI